MRVICMMVSTADGIAAQSPNDEITWSSKADKKRFAEYTKKAGVVIMGRTTHETIGRPLPDRLNVVLTSTPDTFQHLQQHNTLEFTNAAPHELLHQLSERGFTTAMLIGGPKTNSAFFNAGLVNEIMLTIEPVLFGNTGSSLGFVADLKAPVPLKLLACEKLTTDCLLVHYQVTTL